MLHRTGQTRYQEVVTIITVQIHVQGRLLLLTTFRLLPKGQGPLSPLGVDLNR
jgi:hypothetical protein